MPKLACVSLVAGLVVGAACASKPAPSSSGSATSVMTAQPERVARIERGLPPAVQVRGEDVRWTIAERMREYKVPAVSIAVFENYELQWARAYGMADVEAGQAAMIETTFLAGSISKSVNACAQLMAVADGTLASLDTPANEQLESWKLPENELTRAKPVTLRMLLSHTAGTTVHGFPGYVAGTPLPTVQQMLDGEKPANTPAIRVDLAPGTKFRYSGGGTLITQLLLTERSKRPYHEVLAQRVLQPFGMTNSSYDQVLSPARIARAAVGYGGDGVAIRGKRNAYPEMAAAGLWTTASDLARFFAEVARARAGKSTRLSKTIADQMTTKVMDVDESPSAGVGLGVFLMDRNGARMFGHDGSDNGFQAEAVASLDGGYGVVIMANSDNGFRIFRDLERAVFAEYGWPGADPVYERVALEPSDRAKVTGRFASGVGGSLFEIVDSGGKLALREPFGKTLELVPVAKKKLLVREDGTALTFAANGDVVVRPMGDRGFQMSRLVDGARHPILELEAGRFDDAVALAREQAKSDPVAARRDEGRLNGLGYQLMATDIAKAILVLRFNAAVFVDSANAHDSLGEAYMNAGDKARAIEEYERARAGLAGDPRIPDDEKQRFRTHVDEQLAKLRAP